VEIIDFSIFIRLSRNFINNTVGGCTMYIVFNFTFNMADWWLSRISAMPEKSSVGVLVTSCEKACIHLSHHVLVYNFRSQRVPRCVVRLVSEPRGLQRQLPVRTAPDAGWLQRLQVQASWVIHTHLSHSCLFCYRYLVDLFHRFFFKSTFTAFASTVYLYWTDNIDTFITLLLPC